jgi:hypothetical protein
MTKAPIGMRCSKQFASSILEITARLQEEYRL